MIPDGKAAALPQHSSALAKKRSSPVHTAPPQARTLGTCKLGRRLLLLLMVVVVAAARRPAARQGPPSLPLMGLPAAVAATHNAKRLAPHCTRERCAARTLVWGGSPSHGWVEGRF